MFNIAVMGSGLEGFKKLGLVRDAPIRPMDLSVFSM